MANRIRGEISAQIDGRSWTLVLTLGALAELEDTFQCKNLSDLLGRFSAENLSANNIIALIGAGLRGAGHEVTDAQVAVMQVPGGAFGYAAIAADLLSATFGEPSDVWAPEERGQNQQASATL